MKQSDSDQLVSTTKKIDHIFVTFQGKEYRLYKPRIGSNYMLRVQRHGKDIPRTTGTPIADFARKQALTLLKAMFSDTWEEQADVLRHKAKAQSTVGDLVDLYELQAPTELGIAKASAKRNAGQLLRIIELARPLSTVRNLRLEEITDDLARDYIAAARKNGRGDSSIRSSINQARSLFTPRLMHLYKKTLSLPNFRNRDISSQGSYANNRARTPALGFSISSLNLKTSIEEFVPIPAEIVAKMEKEAHGPLRECQPSAYRAYLLMSRLGLRNSEVVAVRRGWFETHNGTRLLVLKDRPQEAFKLKNSLSGAIGVSDALWGQLTEGLSEEWDYLIEERTVTDRFDAAYRTLNNFIRQFLPDRKKGAYELRKWAGSIVATRSGIYAAQQFLRHRSVKTTESYYATYLKTIHGISADELSSIYASKEAVVDPTAPGAAETK